MAFKAVLTVTYEWIDSEGAYKRLTHTQSEALESTVPQSLIEQVGQTLSYKQYKEYVAGSLLAPFTIASDRSVILDLQNGTYRAVRRGDIDSVEVEIKKTLDT